MVKSSPPSVRQPFDMLAETATAAAHVGAGDKAKWRKLRFGWGTWIRTKIDGVRVRCSTVELSPNGRLKAHFRASAWRVNSEAGRGAQAPRNGVRAFQSPPAIPR